MKRFFGKTGWPLATVVVATLLFLLPGRTTIAPAIEADNNYIYLAADRLYAGSGLTSLYPHAPLQPWEWRTDWAFLTQWPVGYPLLLCGVRLLLRCSTVQAGQTIAVLSCAVALVGWFAWVRRVLPKGLAAALLAAVAAGSAVSATALIDPATDIIVVAVLPLVLLLVLPAVSEPTSAESPASKRRRLARLMAAGFLAGLLCWIRYAAIYVPAAVGLFLIARWIVRRRIRLRPHDCARLRAGSDGWRSFAHGDLVAGFGLAAAVPILALAFVNHVSAASVPVQERYNLGSGFGFTLDPGAVATIWWQFTDLPFYNYHWYSHWVYALAIPLGVIAFVCLTRSWRQAWRSFLARPGVILSACVVGTLLVMLAAVSMLFRSKHTYVDIPRYYLAVRPLYFLLLVGPLLCIPRKSVRALACIPLLLCCSWYVQVEWPQPYRRWLAADRPLTTYGRRALRFEPNSVRLYDWLAEQRSEELVIFSNFHDDIALETWIPACPTPGDPDEMNAWLKRIRAARGIGDPRVLFVLQPDNDTRDYFLAPPERIVDDFKLVHPPDVPEEIRQYVYAPTVKRDPGLAHAGERHRR